MVNDCAYVGETLAKYFPSEVSVSHLKRSRSLWGKTFGLAWKILRAEGDVYHVHYLLQDCYLASRFGKQPLVGHAHGSDLRTSLNHRLWGRIVRHNLKHCDKVLVSTPDLLSFAKKYQPHLEYLPNPVNTGIFHPNPSPKREGKLKVLIASGCDWDVKGTDIAVQALSRIKENVEIFIIQYGKDFAKTMALAESLELEINVLPKTSHENMRKYYWNADVVFDQFKYGVMGMITLEAIACGKPVVTYVSSEYKEHADFPLKNVGSADRIIEAIRDSLENLQKKEYAYLSEHHEPRKIARKLADMYVQVIEN